jgi:putative transposase
MIVTYKYRVKSHIGWLNNQSKKVNFVWNYCNQTQRTALKRGDRKWFTGFDLSYLLAGSSRELDLLSGTISAVGEQYANSRKQHKKPYLRWRTNKNLGWIPMRGQCIKYKDGIFKYHGKNFKVFLSRPLPEGKIKDGSSFSQDSRGRWYLNVVIEIQDKPLTTQQGEIGIDLGLKTFATLSTGEKVEGPKSTLKYAQKLAKAQRANKKRQVLKLHDKIKNTRKDFHHKFSTSLVRNHRVIFVGDVNSSALVKTNMAKSTMDAGWYRFKQMLTYKSVMNGVSYKQVNESFSTQICSSCGDKPDSRPKGIADLGIREWVCSSCGSVHDRDVNAAKNILRYGQVTPAVGNP